MVPAWVAFVQIYRSHGYFISDTSLSKLVRIQGEFLESCDEEALIESIVKICPGNDASVKDSIASAVFQACLERWQEPISSHEEDEDCNQEE
jgi:predicted aminopeptidase